MFVDDSEYTLKQIVAPNSLRAFNATKPHNQIDANTIMIEFMPRYQALTATVCLSLRLGRLSLPHVTPFTWRHHTTGLLLFEPLFQPTFTGTA
jgi:hypothetical protein